MGNDFFTRMLRLTTKRVECVVADTSGSGDGSVPADAGNGGSTPPEDNPAKGAEEGGDKGGKATEKYVSVAELAKIVQGKERAETKAKETDAKNKALTEQVAAAQALLEKLGDDPAKALEEFQRLSQKEKDNAMKDMTESERLKALLAGQEEKFKATFAKMEKQLGEIQSAAEKDKSAFEAQKKSFMDTNLANEIISAGAKHNAANPRHLVDITKGLFRHNEESGSWETDIPTDKGVRTVGVSDFIAHFASDPENAYQFKPAHQPRPSAGQPAGGAKNDPAAGELGSISEDGIYMSLGRPLTKDEQDKAMKRGMTDREYANFLARNIVGERSNAEATEKKRNDPKANHVPGRVPWPEQRS